MAILPTINRGALILIKKATAGTLNLGCGVLLNGSSSVENIPLADYPLAQDSIVSGVVYELEPTNSSAGFIAQVGNTNIRLKIGSSGVSVGDKLIIQDSTGVWRVAPIGSNHVYYVALETVAAGNFCWAAPIAGCLIPSGILLQVASAIVTTDHTTTSGSFVDVPEATVTLTTQTGTRLIVTTSFSASNGNIGGASNSFRLVVDGSATDGSGNPYGGAGQQIGLLNATQASAIHRVITGLSSGSHTIKLQWLTSAGTSRIRPVTFPGSEHASISVIEAL